MRSCEAASHSRGLCQKGSGDRKPGDGERLREAELKAEEDRPGLEGTRAIGSAHWPIALFGIRPPEWLNFLCFIF